eukprot:TRINITY_DN19995_c0_g1_i1.p1 TRINITY_DN19995_c0_g1~~TRINITY_DN19995_c0_g1_i1.p1  ORF type:complete len:104 (-),score=4.22 TRINITY_DN19995_c0_g1_i1:7-318(-)
MSHTAARRYILSTAAPFLLSSERAGVFFGKPMDFIAPGISVPGCVSIHSIFFSASGSSSTCGMLSLRGRALLSPAPCRRSDRGLYFSVRGEGVKQKPIKYRKL